jgi:hypothetical protein
MKPVTKESLHDRLKALFLVFLLVSVVDTLYQSPFSLVPTVFGR